MPRVACFAGLAISAVVLGACAPKGPARPQATWYAPPPYGYPPQPVVYAPPAPVVSPWAAPAATYAPPAAPTFARVAFVGLLAGPGKVDGTQWDGPGGTVSAENWRQVAFALGAADPYAAAIGVFAGPTIQALEKPDCSGTASLFSSAGRGVTWDLPKVQDSFTPQWRANWEHVPLDGSVRIRVEVIDRDLAFDDPMGVFEINTGAIFAALRASRVYPVPVADQTNKQVLFALITAQAE